MLWFTTTATVTFAVALWVYVDLHVVVVGSFFFKLILLLLLID